MANITTTTAAKLIAEVWSKEVEKPFYNNLELANLVTRRDSLVKGGGSKINIPFLSSYNARDKAGGTAVTFDANTETEVEVSINKHKYLAFLIEDIAKVQSNYELQQLYRGAQAEALARAVDTDLAGLHGSAGTNIDAGAALEDAEMIQVVEALDAGNVPRSERAGVIHTEAHSDLLAVNKYVTFDNTGVGGDSNPIKSGRVARVYGFDLYISNNLVTEDLTTDLIHNLFFHKKAMSLAMQLKPTYKAEDSVDHIGLKMVLHAIYGVAVERAGALVDVTLNT